MNAPVTLRRRGGALHAVLTRPDALNAITGDTIAGLHDAVDAAERDPDVRVLVLAAEGRAFCAGADLRAIGEIDGASLRTFLEGFGALLERLEAASVPVVAAVHGLAVAGGLELVLACDLVVASRSAAFGDAHANYGLLPGGGSSVRLPQRVGPATARALLFTGETVAAAALAHTDLITRLVADDGLDEAVDDLVAAIAAKSAAGITAMKRLVADAQRLPRPQALAAELDALQEHAVTVDFAEGLAAFAAHRRPVFTGR